MKKLLFAFLSMLLVLASVASAQPTQVSYQGELQKDGVAFSGVAQMKFALVNGGAAYWSNDGSSATGEEPDTPVAVTVDQGTFSVMLGSTGMVPLTASAIFGLTSVSLRMWVDTGGGFEQVSDQPLASSAFTLHSESAERSFTGFTAAGIIESTTGGFKFPDGTTQTTAASGVGGGVTLDGAYDFGGSGAGRTITADAGAVSIQGADGLRVNGSIGVGLTATPFARISVENVGGLDNVKLLSFDEGQGGEFHFESGFSGTGSTGNSLKLNSAWTTGITSWRGDGNVGMGISPNGAKLALFSAGAGSANPTLQVTNASITDGWGLVATTIGTGPTAFLTAGGTGDVLQWGNSVGSANGKIDNAGRIRMVDNFGNGSAGAPIYSENSATGGVAFWGKVSGTDGACILEQNGTGSLMRAFKSGVLKFEVQNSGRVVTTALQITGGGDLAEPFNVAEESITPGEVVVIDDNHAGQLKRSTHAYDTRVAGVVSGAGGIAPGITLTPGDHQVGGEEIALSGRVYVYADASKQAIRPGDLLTTSNVPGHVMKATDRKKTPGAVIGKAMSALDSGRGLVLVLVSLQ